MYFRLDVHLFYTRCMSEPPAEGVKFFGLIAGFAFGMGLFRRSLRRRDEIFCKKKQKKSCS